MATSKPLPVGGDYILGLDIGANSVGWAVLDAVWDPHDVSVPLDEGGKGRWVPTAIRAAGARIFEAGVDDYNTKKEASKAKSRRVARGARRRLKRHAQRLRQLYDALSAVGLLPALGGTPGQQESHAVLRDRALKKLDGLTASAGQSHSDGSLLRWLYDNPPDWTKSDTPAEQERLTSEYFHHLEHRWIYELRARALAQELSLFAVGRCLYHLAERRGFKSNRKVNKPDEQKPEGEATEPKKPARGKPADSDAPAKEKRIGMLDQIRSLRAEIGAGRTLGQHLAVQTPTAWEAPAQGETPRSFRIRNRFTAREMYLLEFDAIWAAQAPHHPGVLTDALRERIRNIIFFQNPLRSQRHLIGRCELEPTEKRVERGTIEFQQLRLLQRLNDLRVLLNPFETRSLFPEERTKILKALEDRGGKAKLSKSEVCALLGSNFKSRKGSFPSINFGDDATGKGEAKALQGNDTVNLMRGIFDGKRGPAWDQLTPAEQDERVDCLLNDEISDEELFRLAQDQFKLNVEAAEEYSQTSLDDKFCSFSRKALRRLLPHLERGTPLSTAIKLEYGDRAERLPLLPLLPPLIPSKPPRWDTHLSLREEWQEHAPAYTEYVPPELRNPVVQRAMTELRKVVNALIRRHGKPAEIVIEYARDMKQPLQKRLLAQKRNEEATKRRDKAFNTILESFKMQLSPESPRDRALVDKWLLAEDQNFTCPYTGKVAQGAEALSDAFEIDHIIPRSRWPNNEWKNKVFCATEANRRKGNLAPSEAFSGEEWEQVRRRVETWLTIKGNAPRSNAFEAKIKLFLTPQDQLQDIIDSWTNRQLVDTAYASRMARWYLGHLYGCLGSTGDLPPDSSTGTGRKVIRVLQGGVTAEMRNALQMNAILSKSDVKTREDHRHHAVDAIVIALTSQATVNLLNRFNALPRQDKEARAKIQQQLTERFGNFTAEAKDVTAQIIVSHRPDRGVSQALHKESIYSLRDAQGRRPKSAAEASDATRFSSVASRTKVTSLTSLDKVLNKGTRRAIEQVLTERLGISLDDSAAVKKALPKLTGPLTPVLQSAKTETLIPIKSVVTLEKGSAQPIGKGHRLRYLATDPNHHIEIYEIIEGPDKGKWTGRMVKVIDAYARINERKGRGRQAALFVENKPHLWPAGTRLVCELCKGDTVLLTVDGQRKPYRVRNFSLMSPTRPDIVFDPVNEGRREKDRKDSKVRLSSWEAVRKLQPRRVQVSPIGQVSPNHDQSGEA